MLLASATLLTGCSIGGKEIVLDIKYEQPYSFRGQYEVR